MKDIEAITAIIKNMQGKFCWFVNSTSVAGTFSLAIGDKIPRKTKLTNVSINSDFREYEGEYNLYVWCTWRAEFHNRVITSSDDTCESLSSGLEKITGSMIESIELIPPGMDLTILFDNGYRLKVFCDHVPGNPSFEGNWDLFGYDYNIHAGPGENITYERNMFSRDGTEEMT